MQHSSYMGEALEEAKKAYKMKEVPIGAVVVQDDRIIGRGHNLREKLLDSTAHAEILAMREAARTVGSWRLHDCTLYTTVEPCCMCAGAIVQFRIKTLVYGTKDPKAGGVDSLMDLVRDSRLNHQVEVIAGVRQEECAFIIRTFFQGLRKKHKEQKIES